MRALSTGAESLFEMEGLCGRAVSPLKDCLFLDLPPSVTTVEVDEEDVEDSRTVERVCGLRVFVSSGVLCLVTGGRLCKGLACFVRCEFRDRAVPGEYDDIDVGVDETLNGPGDPEYLVEGVAERAYCGAGRGRTSVEPSS